MLGISTMDPNRVLPSVWIRCFQIARYLEQSGYQISLNTVEPRPDIAIFLRRYSSADLILMKKLKANGAAIVVDTVAGYFQSRDSFPEGYGGASPKQVSEFLKAVEIADQVWAVSPYLRDQALQINPNSHFVSDSVDPQHFNPGNSSKDKPKRAITLGWSGAFEKANELNEISPVIKKLIGQKNIKVNVITRKRPNLTFPFEFQRWHYSTFPQMISACDLCIAPRRVRNDYDMGHSLFKIGVFMTMCVPALAGPVPSYSLLLEDGEAGAICHSLEEWASQLERFIRDPSRLSTASCKALDKMKPYLTPSIAAQVCGLLESLLAR